MKDNHKKWHETLHYKERGDWDGVEGNVPSVVPSVGPLLAPPIIIMDLAHWIKARRGKSERNAEGAMGWVAV